MITIDCSEIEPIKNKAITGTDGSQLFKPDREAILKFIDEALLESVSEKEGGTSVYCPLPPPR